MQVPALGADLAPMHDWLAHFHGGTAFPLTVIAVKLAVSIAVGLLVGFEREWANKDIGVRTFALASVLGFLGSLESGPFGVLSGSAILIIIAVLNFHSVRVAHKLEATTSVALMVVFLLGVLAGHGHLFTPIACSIVVTMLLSLKPQLHAFAGGLRQEEVRSAILLALLGFVIWPLLPNRFIDPWDVINPRDIWVVVIVLASLGFVNYVLLRAYGSRGLYMTAILGGLVNSTASVAELTPALRDAGMAQATASVVLLTTVAMFVRNIVILALFAHNAVSAAAIPLAAMSLVGGIWIYLRRRRPARSAPPVSLPLVSPVSLQRVLSFAALFVAIQVVSTLLQRAFGTFGLHIASLIGGLASSAGMTAAAADLVIQGKILASQAGTATVLASIASVLVDLPLVHKQARDRQVIREVYSVSILQLAVGIAATFVELHIPGLT